MLFLEVKSLGVRRRIFFIEWWKGLEVEDGGSRKEFGYKRV